MTAGVQLRSGVHFLEPHALALRRLPTKARAAHRAAAGAEMIQVALADTLGAIAPQELAIWCASLSGQAAATVKALRRGNSPWGEELQAGMRGVAPPLAQRLPQLARDDATAGEHRRTLGMLGAMDVGAWRNNAFDTLTSLAE